MLVLWQYIVAFAISGFQARYIETQKFVNQLSKFDLEPVYRVLVDTTDWLILDRLDLQLSDSRYDAIVQAVSDRMLSGLPTMITLSSKHKFNAPEHQTLFKEISEWSPNPLQ